MNIKSLNLVLLLIKFKIKSFLFDRINENLDAFLLKQTASLVTIKLTRKRVSNSTIFLFHETKTKIKLLCTCERCQKKLFCLVSYFFFSTLCRHHPSIILRLAAQRTYH